MEPKQLPRPCKIRKKFGEGEWQTAAIGLCLSLENGIATVELPGGKVQEFNIRTDWPIWQFIFTDRNSVESI